MTEPLTFAVSPSTIGAFLGLAGFMMAMALFQQLLVAIAVLIVISMLFPFLYIDRSPRCVYCFGKIAKNAQFCPHCGRIQPESE